MKDRTFRIILAVTLALCVIGTLLHVIYIADAYEHCSIIRFVAEEHW